MHIWIFKTDLWIGQGWSWVFFLFYLIFLIGVTYYLSFTLFTVWYRGERTWSRRSVVHAPPNFRENKEMKILNMPFPCVGIEHTAVVFTVVRLCPCAASFIFIQSPVTYLA